MQAYAQEAPPPNAPETVEQAVNVDPAYVLDTVESWVVGFQRLLPNIVVALVVFGIAMLAAWLVRRSFVGWARRHHRADLGVVVGTFLRWAVIAGGTLVALTIVIPSLRPGDLVAGLGIGSVAIGFAFKDILQNWLAGLLILLRQPFRPGDQIVVDDYEGTVQRIETRATIIKTYDGRDVIIPNADLYSKSVTVNTAHEKRRSDYDIGIGYEDSIEDARRVILEAVSRAPGVEAEPRPEVLVWDFAPSSVNLRLRWWTHSLRTDVVHARAAVLEAVKKALDESGISIPYPTQLMLFHDPTAAAHANRGEQQDGSPRPREVLVDRIQRQARG